MNFKQMISLVLLSIGIVLIVFALHQRGYIPSKMERSKIITNSPVSPTERLPDTEAVIVAGRKRNNETLILIGGIVLVLVGVGVAIRYKHG